MGPYEGNVGIWGIYGDMGIWGYGDMGVLKTFLRGRREYDRGGVHMCKCVVVYLHIQHSVRSDRCEPAIVTRRAAPYPLFLLLHPVPPTASCIC
ncbi:hypothetical protein B484DRAFT_447508 [Ochromonadaceae sp. CCMP2298]|nr:hypothetical protein B484DRAFT_447508 [Ochromonadaceae sp. CCMP2298]